MTVEFFAYARWVGFFWIMAMLVIAFLVVANHRLIFLSMLLWISSLFAVTAIRQTGDAATADFVRDWIATPLEYLVPIAMTTRVMGYLRKHRGD